MKIFTDFLNTYGMPLLYSVVTAIMGYVGLVIKRLYEKYLGDSTKRAVAKTVVGAVEQLYKDLHGEEKYQKAAEAMSEMLTKKGIKITDLEIKMLVEAAVNELSAAIGNGADA